MSLGEVGFIVSIIPLGGGAGEPLMGISPAKAETERTHAKAIAAKNRFIGILL
jgi:hypothetical protein